MEFKEQEPPLGPRVTDWRGASVPVRGILQGRYCRLVPLDPQHHAAELFAANSRDREGAMWRYLPYGPFETLQAYRDWMAASCGSDDPLFYVIIDESDGKAVGLSSFLRITPQHGTIEIGHLAYSPQMQRSRLSTEANALLLRHAFALGYRRVEWKCNALNAASRAAARRLGFSFEGLFRHHLIVKQRSRDTAWYAIVECDWPAIDAAQRRWLDPANFDEDGTQRVALSELTAPLRQPAPSDS